MNATQPRTARELVLDAEARFVAAGLVFGHGTDNARDEAVYLVFHALQLPFDASEEVLDRVVTETERAAAEAIVAERVTTRRPAAYLTGRAWFAGHEFQVDQRVLVPRSPLAELINARFRPWLEPDRLYRILEIGTGSGCIAIATAIAARYAEVDATDISGAALAVATLNLARYPAVSERVRLLDADLFPPTDDCYDLIIANPPYVPSPVVAGLPPEYAYEPCLALDAGPDGLSLVRRILNQAPARLNEGGALIVDVGKMAAAIDLEFPSVSFTWIDLEHGGEGVGVAYKSDFHE
ncbi:MAG: 50S ribosomal protein L3 N(5)-glutamine methyltransferase [Gammaproteobacteria bacterium]|nr:50S ribosomal protein L3 N(5)-glutamine methyltransferase [Gammaproteobacteria bacterium]